MNKKLMIGLAAGFVMASCIAAAKKASSEPSPDVWTKLRAKFDEMPPDFPPRLMFDNVEAARENTEEILSLLRRDGAAAAELVGSSAAR